MRRPTPDAEDFDQFQRRASLPQRTVAELVDEGLPMLEPYLCASVKVKESHEAARPLIDQTRATS